MNEQTSPENQLKGTGWLLIFVGIFSCIVGAVQVWMLDIDTLMAEAGAESPEEKMVFQAIIYFICAITFGMSLLFIVFGVFVFRFPVICTVGALLLYLMDAAAGMMMGMTTGIVIKIIIVFLLIQGVRSAFAYKRERRALAEAYEYGDPHDYAPIDDLSRNTF